MPSCFLNTSRESNLPSTLFNHPFSEEILPDGYSELLLVQLGTLFFCPVTGCLGEGADSHLTTASSQEVLESSQFSAGPPSIPKLTNIINRVPILNE